MQVQVTLDPPLDIVLNELAQINGVSTETYATNIVKTFLEDQYRGRFRFVIEQKTISELKDIEQDPIFKPKKK